MSDMADVLSLTLLPRVTGERPKAAPPRSPA
jgi:hypothetical protein